MQNAWCFFITTKEVIKIEAITREEVLLQSIAEGKEVTLEPKTRLEWWLKKIAESSGSGGVSSWNDLTDKPFYKEEKVENVSSLEWNGDTTDRTIVEVGNGMYLVHISDAIPTYDNLLVGSLVANSNGEEMQIPLNDANYETDVTEDQNYIMIGRSYMYAFVAKTENCLVADTVTFEKAGTYVMCAPSMGMYISSLIVDCFAGTVTYHKLDNNYVDSEWLATKSGTRELLLSKTVITGNTETVIDLTLDETTWRKDYTIIVDGVPYISWCSLMNDTYYFLGAGKTISENIAPPFGIYCDKGSTETYIKIAGDGDHSVIVYSGVVNFRKLPTDYLPVMNSVILKSCTPNSSKQFALLVNDSGTVIMKPVQ